MALTDRSASKLIKSLDSVELTETVVLTRTRAPDLESVKKLNCWASNIGDVSVVRRMPALEVCSLSINKITSLRDFAHCHNLKELYVRTNKIERLGDIHYLKHLRKLRSLWLSENPCAGEPNYRMTVLRTLPNLRKLDNIAVTEDEVQQAETNGDQIAVPEDFSSSSIFKIDAFNQSSSKPSTSPPDSARSVDSTRSTADSLASNVGISVENSVGDSVSVDESNSRWALPRRKRQQRKRQEMLRSSGGEEGGGSARSGEDSSGAGEGKRSGQVSGSSDSHPEEDSDVNYNCKSNSEDEVQKSTRDTAINLDNEEGALENRDSNIRGASASPVRDSVTSENNKIDEELRIGHTVDEQCSHKENDQKVSPTDGISARAIEVTASNQLNSHPKFPSVPKRIGSINLLRISDLEETVLSENPLSNNNTLIPCSEAQSGEDDSNINNNSNNNENIEGKQNQDINLNEVNEDKPSITPHLSSAETSQPSPIKQRKHSLLDQIRLDDSLDVLDSAAEENSSAKQDRAASVDPEHLEIEIDQTKVSSAEDLGRETNKEEPRPDADVTPNIVDLTIPKNSRQKPPVSIKPKPAQVNLAELNRMRVELGLKPMNNTRSSTLPANPEVSEAKSSNVLTAVLCLLKELDKDSLDIVGAAVKAKLEALE